MSRGKSSSGTPGKGTTTFAMSLEGPDRKAVHYCAALSGTADAETAETGVDLPAAEAIAQAGRGVCSTDPSVVAAACVKPREHELLFHRPLWPWLVMAAILLWPVDLLLRKVL